MQICGVCNEQIPKYRCPTCKIRYCSVICYRRHKDGDWTVEDLIDEENESDRVPLERLKKLGDGESADLEALLRNPHLRQLLLTVDRSENKVDIMKSAMQEPLFVEFADRCLKIVEPAEKEDF